MKDWVKWELNKEELKAKFESRYQNGEYAFSKDIQVKRDQCGRGKITMLIAKPYRDLRWL